METFERVTLLAPSFAAKTAFSVIASPPGKQFCKTMSVNMEKNVRHKEILANKDCTLDEVAASLKKHLCLRLMILLDCFFVVVAVLT